MPAVRLVSLRAEQLAPEDGDTADPYVKIKIGDKEFKTEKISKNCVNPNWRELQDVQFQWDGVATLPIVEFTAFDHDTFSSDDFLGYKRLQLEPHMMDEEMKVKLVPKKDQGKDLLEEYGSLGHLFFTFHFDGVIPPPPAPAAAPTAINSPMGSATVSRSLSPPGHGPSTPPHSAPLLQYAPGVVRLVSLRGENLVPEDGDTCDPYVVIKLGGKEFKTETIKKNCQNPKFKELNKVEFMWDGVSSMPDVEFTVWDYDTFSRDDFIGYKRMQFHPSMLDTETKVVLGIRDESDAALLNEYGTLGNIYFGLHLEPSGSPPSGASRGLAPVSAAPGRLTAPGAGRIRITRIRTESRTPTDPDCKLYVVVSAQVRPATQFISEIIEEAEAGYVTWKKIDGELIWDGTSPLPVCDITLKGVSRHGHVDVGSVRLPLHSSMFGQETRVVLKPCPDAPTYLDQNRSLSCLMLSLGVVPISPNERVTPHMAIVQPQRPIDGSEAGAITVTVHQATGLPPSSEAFVVIQARSTAGKVFNLDRTSAQRCRTPPQWEYTSSLSTLDPVAASIWLCVCDLDAGGTSQLLGECELIPDVSRPGAATRQNIPLRMVTPQRAKSEITASWEVPPGGAAGQRGARDIVSLPGRRTRERAAAAMAPLATLYVTVLSATNLPYPCDPYARIRFFDQSADNRDAAGQHTTMALWNFATSFPCDATQNSYPVAIDIVSDNRVVGTAQAQVPAKSSKQSSVILALADRDGTPSGEIAAIFLVETAPKETIHDIEDAVVELCVVGAKGLAQKGTKPVSLAPYVIVLINGKESELEYTSPSVRGTANPLWYFSVPSIQLDSTDVVSIGVWNEDSFGFDTSLGVATLEAAHFLEGGPSPLELQLENREGESPGPENSVLSVEYFVRSRTKSTATSAPHVVEITVHQAQNLTRSSNPAAVVHISCDDQPGTELSTKVVPKGSAKWEETQQLRLDGLRNRLRLTVWDSDIRGADFLGECFLDLSDSALLKEQKTQKLALRPRRDSHFYTQDVVILNQLPTGLGSLYVSVKAFTVHQYETQMRERLKKRGASYTLFLQVSDSADVAARGTYYLKVNAGNTELMSQCETSAHPKFRKTFEIELQYDTEMIYLNLMERGSSGESLVGEVSFPVNPPERIGVDPISTWVSLKGPRVSLARPTQLLIRWRTTRTLPMQSSGGAQAPSSRGQTTEVYSPQGMRSGQVPYSSAAAESPEVQELRNEVSVLRSELMKVQGTTPASQQRGASSFAPSPGGYSIHVYSPQGNRLTRFRGHARSTVADVMHFVAPEFGLRLNDQHMIVYRDAMLPPTQPVQNYVPEGETVMILPWDPSLGASALVSGSHTMANQQQQQARSSSPYSAVARTVIERLRKYGPETGISTAMLTLQQPSSSSLAATLFQRCVAQKLTGFARGAENNGSATEIVIQGVPSKLADVLVELLMLAPDSEAAEIKGYIPIMSPGFRIATTHSEGTRMFEICSLPFEPEGGQKGTGTAQSWFYKSVDSTESGPPPLGVRYVDERA